MNDIATVISQLEQQRATIDRALAALREVEGMAGTALGRHTTTSARGVAQPRKKQVSSHGSGVKGSPEFTGNRTEFIRAIIESRASSGVTPREIAEEFTAHRIKRGKNLIRNTLYKMLDDKRLKRENGRYFPESATSSAKSSPQKKRRISPEGRKRIIAANKKRAAKHGRPARARKVSAKKAARTAA